MKKTRFLSIWIIVLMVLTFVGITPAQALVGSGPAASYVPPKLLTPKKGATVVGSVNYSWKAVSGALGYDVQISTVADFSNLVWFAHLHNTKFDVEPSLTPGTYYWRSRSEYVEGVVFSEYGPAYSFTVAAPRAPTSTMPTTGTTEVPFTWTKVAGAATYEIQWDLDSSFTDPDFVDQSGITPPFSKVIPIGITYWRVRARDSIGNDGDWSPTYTYTATLPPMVTVLSPVNNAEIVGQPNFKWAALKNISYYEIEYDSVSDFSNTPDSGTFAGTSVNDLSLAPSPDAYYWHIRGVDVYSNVGPWSATYYFTMVAPAAVNVTAPIDGATITGDVQFSFTNVPGNINCYYLLMDKTDQFNGPNRYTACVDPITHKISAPTSVGKWYWKLQADSTHGQSGPYTSMRSFTIAAPLAPALSSPKNGSAYKNLSVITKWKASKGAATYTIEFDDNADMGSTFITVPSIVGQQFNDVLGILSLTHGTVYWHVAAVDSGGNQSPWSATWSFILP